MKQKACFNLEEQIKNWTEKLYTNPSFTESDVEEIKSHLYDSIDSLLEAGLNEEEAFVLAKLRMGNSYEINEAYKEANQPVIQMRRSLLILAGILVYFMIYYFILSSSKLLAIVLLKTGVDTHEALEWVSRCLITWHFIIVLFFTTLFFLERKTISFIENINLKPRFALLFLGITGVFALADTALFPELKKILGENDYAKDLLYHNYIYFDFSFPLLIGICFVVIYYRYYRKTKQA